MTSFWRSFHFPRQPTQESTWVEQDMDYFSQRVLWHDGRVEHLGRGFNSIRSCIYCTVIASIMLGPESNITNKTVEHMKATDLSTKAAL